MKHINAILLSLISSTSFAAFNQIQCFGHVNVMINQRANTQNSAYATRNARSVQIRQSGGILSIKESAHSNGKPVNVAVNVKNLNRLSAYGSCTVTANYLNSAKLSIYSDNNGSITLNGKVNLVGVIAKGSGSVNVQWVDSQNVTIIAGENSILNLAGATNFLSVRAIDDSKVNVQYLRAIDALAQAQDDASIDVLGLNSLRAFAGDWSNIYYYKQPRHLTKNTTESGNVLQTDWRA